MAGNEELISEYIDRDGIRGDTEFVLTDLNKINETLNQIFNTKRSFGKSVSFSEIISGAKQLTDATAKLDQQNKQSIDTAQKTAAAQEQLNNTRKTSAILTEDEARAKVKAQDTNRQTIASVKAETDEYKALILARDKAAGLANTAQAKAAKTGDTGDQANADALSAQAKQLTDQLKAIEAKAGQNFRNVGNYTMSFTDALKILEQELASVNSKIKDETAAGNQNSEAFARMAEQAGLLEVLVNKQKAGFTSVTQEIRTTERALQTLSEQGYAGTEAFNKLRASTIEAAQAQKEFARQQKLLESEAPLLGALTLAAKGLAGAYAIGQGSISLFAEGNEKVEKELNKLVAVLTILQGLREAYELIQQAGAVSLAIQLSLTKAATAVQGQFATSTQAAAVANTELAASEGAVATGAGAETAALAETAIAAEGATAAIGETEVASTALSTTLLATGIGAAIAGIAVAVIYLLSKIPDWIKGNDLTIKQQGELADAIKSANAALVEQAEFISKLDTTTKKYYENQIALSNAAGQNEVKRFALQKALTAEEKDNAKNQIDLLGADNTQQSKLASTIDNLNLKRREAIRIQTELLAVPEQLQTSEQKEQLIAAGKNIELYGKQIESITPLYNAGQKAREEYFGAIQKEGQEEVQISKFTADERRKIILESTKLEADLVTAKNDIILSDERSTLEQRLQALKSNAEATRRVIEADKNNVLTDPGASPADRENAIRSAAEKEKTLNLKLAEDRRKDTDAANQREIAARLAVSQEILNDQLKNDQAILNEDKSQQELSLHDFDAYLGKRQAALADSYRVRKALISANEIDAVTKDIDQNKTPAERLKTTIQFFEQYKELDRTFQKEITDEDKKELDLRLAQIQKFYDDQKRVILEGQAGQVKTLTDNFIKGNISYQQYSNQRQEIDFQATKKSLEDKLAADFKAQEAAKNNLDEQKKANADYAADSIALNDLIAKHKQDQESLKSTRNSEILKAAEATAETLKSFEDDRYENEINHIQSLIDANNKYKETQINNIKNSTLSAQDKAAEEQRLNLETAAQNEALQRRQRDLKVKEAQFDKAFAIAQIIEQTSIAVIAALKIPIYGEAEAIAIGIIGAANIAKVAATPIPTYKQGIGFRNDKGHPGGPAITGDGYEPELIHEPGKAPYWSPATPTLSYLAPNTIVVPKHEVDEINRNIHHRWMPMPSVESIDHRALQGEISGLREDVQNQTRELSRAYSKQKPAKIIIKDNSAWAKRIQEQVYS